MNIEDILQPLKERIGEPLRVEPDASVTDVTATLSTLISDDPWGNEQLSQLDFIARKIEIAGFLKDKYTASGTIHPDALQLSGHWMLVAAAILVRRFVREQNEQLSEYAPWKPLNTALKSIDLARTDLAGDDQETALQLWNFAQSQLRQLWHAPPAPGPFTLPCANKRMDLNARLTVLHVEGPISRAYLATLRSLGVRPARIVHLVAARDLVSRKELGQLLPVRLRVGYASAVNARRIHHWPNYIRRRHRELSSSIIDTVAGTWGFDRKTINDALDLTDLSEYSSNVVRILANGFADPRVLDLLNETPGELILFTGGGIVPKRLLEACTSQLLHIHPGFLPLIRGADCALWSVLLTGQPSASAFHLAPGIDEGDIVSKHWLPPISFGRQFTDFDGDLLYRAIFSLCDPWIRSFALRDLIDTLGADGDYPSVTQRPDQGETYHFMHAAIRDLALKAYFSEPGSNAFD